MNSQQSMLTAICLLKLFQNCLMRKDHHVIFEAPQTGFTVTLYWVPSHIREYRKETTHQVASRKRTT